jgi:hypothetical protein
VEELSIAPAFPAQLVAPLPPDNPSFAAATKTPPLLVMSTESLDGLLVTTAIKPHFPALPATVIPSTITVLPAVSPATLAVHLVRSSKGGGVSSAGALVARKFKLSSAVPFSG